MRAAPSARRACRSLCAPKTLYRLDPAAVGRAFHEPDQSGFGREIKAALELVGIAHLVDSEVRHLSGGEFQRALLARAIARKPDLLVLDEPVQGVDFSGEIALYDLISNIRTTLGCGILMISHDLHVVMASTTAWFASTGMSVVRVPPMPWPRAASIVNCSGPARQWRWPSMNTPMTTRICPTARCATQMVA